jgi:glyoxylate/hydroxypyruvate reductase
LDVLVQSSWPTIGRWLDELKHQAPHHRFHVWPDVPDSGAIEAALVWNPPPGLFDNLVNLKAVLSLGAGVDHLLRPGLHLPDVPIARLVDPVMTQRMAEYVLYGVLHFHRQFDVYAGQAMVGSWERHQHLDPVDIPVGIMGMGSMGEAAAVLLRAVGYPILGWARSPHKSDRAKCFAGQGELDAFLAEAAIVVCLLPLTDQTRGILNARTFRHVQHGSYVINVARGEHIVEEDLLEALESGQVAGAMLDVFTTEPLPADSPLWRHPRVVVTPHVASLSNPKTGAAVLADQLRRLERGEELLHKVDVDRGY